MSFLGKFQKPLSSVLKVGGALLSGAGALGVPYAGLVGSVLKMGGELVSPKDKVLTAEDLSKLEDGVADMKLGVENVKGNITNLTEEVRDVKAILNTGFSEMTNQVKSLKTELENIEKRAAESFEILKEMHYLDGIENIHAAHTVFFSVSKMGLDKKISNFESHQFELQKQYTQHLSPRKIKRFLKLLSEESDEGQAKAINMFEYIMTVEAEYLRMMAFVHIYNEDYESLIAQLQMFIDHNKELSGCISLILRLEKVIPSFTFNGVNFKNFTKIHEIVITQNEKEMTRLAPFLTPALLCQSSPNTSSLTPVNKPIHSRRKTSEDCFSLYHMTPLWIAAESGNIQIITTLLSLEADPTIPAVSKDGISLSCVQVAAQMGHLPAVKLLLALKATVNIGKNSLLEPCRMGRTDIAKVLVEAGERIDFPGQNGETPLQLALQGNHQELASLLIASGADKEMAQLSGEKKEQLKKEQERETHELHKLEEDRTNLGEQKEQMKKEQERETHELQKLEEERTNLGSSYFLLENQLKEGYVLQSVGLEETPIMASRSEENLGLQLWTFDGDQLVAWSGLVLDVIRASTLWSRDRVVMSTSNGGPSQQFKFINNEIVSVRDYTVLDVNNGTKVRMYGRKGTSSSQKWNQITSTSIPGACIVSADEGEAAEHHGGRMGLYRQLDGASYQQVGGPNFLYQVLPERHWYISDKLMKTTGAMINTRGSSSVPASGWKFHAGAGELRADSLLSVRVCGQEEELQCGTISITSTRCRRQEALGIFTKIPGDTLNGVPVFRNTSNLYLRVPTGFTTWRVSDERDDKAGWLQSGRATSCPAHRYSGLSRRYKQQHWRHVDEKNEWAEDPTLHVACNIHVHSQ